MSRIGREPIEIPSNVKVEINGNTIKVSGPLGELTRTIDPKISVKVENGKILVERHSDEKQDRERHGLYRALINNMVQGVEKGFSKTLVIAGVGYKASVQGDKLVMSLGLSHPVEVVAPQGIKLSTKDANTIVVSGIDKELVGETTAKIRAKRPVEPYHLYGIHYSDEKLTKKEGKKAAAVGKK